MLALLLDSLTPWNVLAALLVLVITRRALSVHERLFVSPLRHIPCSSWSLAFPEITMLITLRGKNAFRSLRLHHELGSVVRVGAEVVSIVDPQIVHQLIRVEDIPKNDAIYKRLRLFDGEAENLLQATDRVYHKQARRMVSPAFSIKYLNNLEPFMCEIWQAFEKMAKREAARSEDGKARLDATQFFHNIAMDAIGTTAFGKSFGMVETGANQLLQAINNLLVFSQVKMIFPLLSRINWKYLPIRASMELVSHTRASMLHEREAMNQRGDKRQDILQMLLDHVDTTGHRLSPAEVTNNANLFILAGSETSANTMTWLLYYVFKHPSVKEKLVAEIDAAFPSGLDHTVDLRTLKTLRYLDAVIKETMRIRNVVTGLARMLDQPTAVTATSPTGVKTQHMLPAGTKIIIPLYAVHNSKQIWLRADEFLPERWLSDSAALESTEYEAWGIGGSDNVDNDFAEYGKPRLVNKDAYWPFSTGSRDCIGRNFALNEIRTMIGHLFRRFDVEPAYDPAEVVEGAAVLTLRFDRKGGLPITLKPRTS
ncbi:cytochrome P450 [Gonapodya prolifera JEL478]|uniref:Cytochrome P450 n=1 Tax=Gonapodya prolifera (strain JEL478) TaxID=1344416 RepID=A0A139A367_GONPJ|nr:cytochrome P450 [Gonapodya prolifera JEL478]|eukprot:KXS11256.1 cytochrome P450 [Gonapodya prolifera JEL478]